MNKMTKSKQTEIGDGSATLTTRIPEGWKQASLGGISSDISYGYTAIASDIPVGPKFLRITDIQGNYVDWHSVPYCQISEEDTKKYQLDSGDICIARTGASTGTNYTIKNKKENAVFASYLIRYKIDRSVAEPLYIGFLLKSSKWKYFVASIIGGLAQPGANAKQFASFEFILPPLPEQRAIAKILSDLDEKIELNNQMNKTLEAIGQAIFKRWFVDFEFPDKNGKPYKSSGGKMVDSELGDIPQGCAVKEISDYGKVICGKTPPIADKENYGEDFFFITIPDMRGQAFIIKTERKLSKQGASIQENKELPPLSICVSCIATPGLVSITSDFSHTNQQINSIICKKDVSPYFMYYTMLDRSEEIKAMGLGGTATLNLNTGNFSRIKVIIPNQTIMDSFHKLVTPVMETVLSNLKENISLCEIRDSLLPRLMSGKMGLYKT